MGKPTICTGENKGAVTIHDIWRIENNKPSGLSLFDMSLSLSLCLSVSIPLSQASM